MGDTSAVSIATIEEHKENIMPLASGRSARSLVLALSPLSSIPQAARDAHSAKKLEFEEELREAAELDDPLEVWVRYVNWTIETYPSGHSSDSSLLQLLERATKEFIHEPHYKNDPRYLKLWIHYIQNFSDAPREHFSFLARNDIGQRLASFYEEFAAYLESIDRRKQAAEIYQLGMENNARPTARLMRKYDEFQKRLEANPIRQDEPSSPALPAVRPALASKSLPFVGSETGSSGPPNPQAQQTQPATMGPPPRPPREKMAIFSDTDAARGANPGSPILGAGSGPGGWESIGTLEHRRKENIQEPRPWAGEILKQQGTGGRAVAGEKMTIFRDGPTASLQQNYNAYPIPGHSAVPAAPGKRPEKVVANLELVYPNPNDPTDEYSFEEIRAMSKGCYRIDWKRMREDEELERKRRQKRSRSGLEVEVSSGPITIATKLESPGPGKSKLKKKSAIMRSGSPTMTLHTRAATDEIYEILNKPLDEVDQDEEDPSEFDSEEDTNDVTGVTTLSRRGGESDDEDANSDWSDDDTKTRRKADFSSLDETGISYEDETVGLTDDTYFQKFTKGQIKEEQEKENESQDNGKDGEHQEDEEPDLPPIKPRKLFIPRDPQFAGGATPQPGTHSYSGSNRLPFMTPIVEQTESLPPTSARRKDLPDAVKTPSRAGGSSNGNHDLLDSSPFHDIVNDHDLDLSIPPIPQRAPPVKANTASAKQGEKKAQTLASKKAQSSIPTTVAPIAKKLPLAPAKSNPVPELPSQPQSQPGGKLQGPIIKETQCNPIDPDIRKQVLAKLNPPLKTYEGYYHYSDTPGSGKRELIQRFAKNKKDNGDLPQPVYVEFKRDGKGTGCTGYTFKKELGKGTYGPVYLVENNTVMDSQAYAKDEEENDQFSLLLETRNHKRKALEAIKFELDQPPSPWEFYILRSLHRRLGVSRPAESIVIAHELHLFQRELYMVLEYKNHRSILDAINLAKSEAVNGTGGSTGGAMDELMVMWLSIELLRTVEAMHSKGIIHGDLKADNCLMRIDAIGTGAENELGSKYKRDGSLGWNRRGISLIDFGMGIDMKCFPEKVAFIADWEIDPQQHCMEIKEMRPWTYQIDYYGLAGIIHLMLFGRYMEVNTIKEGGLGASGLKTYKIQSSFKRYWQGDIWGRLFDLLLNPNKYVTVEDRNMLPATKAVRGVREEMETWLEGNAEKGMGLRNLVKKMELGLRRK